MQCVIVITVLCYGTGIGVWDKIIEARAKPFERMHVSEYTVLHCLLCQQFSASSV